MLFIIIFKDYLVIWFLNPSSSESPQEKERNLVIVTIHLELILYKDSLLLGFNSVNDSLIMVMDGILNDS